MPGHKLDPNTGEELTHFDIRLPGFDPFAPPPQLFDEIGALASDGTFLYAGVKGTGGITGAWYKIDPQNPEAVPPAQEVLEFAGILPFMPGFESMELSMGTQVPDDRSLLASGSVSGSGPATLVARFDKDTGVMLDQFDLSAGSGAKDVRGMAYATSTRTLYLADDATDSILGTALPENTGVELTAVGSYSSQLRVDVDPAVSQVEVGIQLPFTEFVSDSVSTSQSANIWDVGDDGSGALWHIACGNSFPGFPGPDRVGSPPCSWRYGIPDSPHFDTGSRTQGELTTKDTIPVSPGAELEFFTAYATELAPGADIKAVEVARVTTDLQGNDVVGAFKPILHIVGKGGGFAPPPQDAEPSFKYVELDPLFINPSMVPVNVTCPRWRASGSSSDSGLTVWTSSPTTAKAGTWTT